MFVHYRTQGLIFKKEGIAEADQLFTVFSKDFGKIKILGRAIRKISSKLRSGMAIFFLSEIEFIQGKNYKTLTDAIPIKKFQNLRKSLKRLSVAYRISEMLDSLIDGQEPEEDIWNLLLEVFEKLDGDKLKIEKLKLVYYYFYWNLLSILGYKPELYFCISCQKKIKPEKLYFSHKEGGIVCRNCFLKIKSGKEIRPEMIKVLRIILERDWETLSKLRVETEYLKSLEVFSKDYSNFILEKKI